MDGLNVKELRKELNKTQSQLAEEMGVTTRTIQKWESGDKIPPAMENLLTTYFEKTSNTKNDFNYRGKEINQEIIKSLIDELDSQRHLSQKFQEQIDRLLTIVEKLSNK